MAVRVVTIDFWDTLYRHTGTAEYRRQIRRQALLKALRLMDMERPEAVADSFFETVDSYIKSRWSEGSCPTRTDAIEHAYSYFGHQVTAQVLESLLDTSYELYTNELKPEQIPGAAEFITWASLRWPLYLLSDTYTLPGLVLDRLLAQDDLLALFRGRFYSDQLGWKKPDPRALTEVARLERADVREIVHIGDLPETDGQLCQRAGSRCILLSSRRTSPEHDLRGGTIYYARDFPTVKAVLVALD